MSARARLCNSCLDHWVTEEKWVAVPRMLKSTPQPRCEPARRQPSTGTPTRRDRTMRTPGVMGNRADRLQPLVVTLTATPSTMRACAFSCARVYAYRRVPVLSCDIAATLHNADDRTPPSAMLRPSTRVSSNPDQQHRNTLRDNTTRTRNTLRDNTSRRCRRFDARQSVRGPVDRAHPRPEPSARHRYFQS
jgi:hypothetical protein